MVKGLSNVDILKIVFDFLRKFFSGLIEYLEPKEKCYQALLSTIILSKCFHVKLWENSPYVSKQLPGIGTVMSSQFVNAGKTTFQLISECDPREIELVKLNFVLLKI